MITELLKSPPAKASTRLPTILCVDDEPQVLSSLRRLFRREPWDVLTTDRPDEALEWIAQGEISLLLIDQRMPGMTGTELLESARLVAPSTFGVILTAWPETHVLLDSANQGARGVIAKPWDNEALKRTVRELLSRREWELSQRSFLGSETERRGLGAKAASLLEELVLRLDCQGRATASVIRPISAVLRHPRAARSGLVILLERLDGLGDPLPEFFDALVRRIGRSGVRPCVVDGLGHARGHIERLGGEFPYLPFGPAPGRTARSRVLISVEDARDGSLLEALAGGMGFAADVASSSDEGEMRVDTTPYQLVLLSADLPGSGGARLGRHIRDRGIDIPVVLISAALDRWDTDDCERLAVKRLLPQPFRLRDLAEVLGGETK
ncbi:MAG: response regulator [Planctomycetes bacterium]|nr:response regulator [Planctomycetota bacterium]